MIAIAPGAYRYNISLTRRCYNIASRGIQRTITTDNRQLKSRDNKNTSPKQTNNMKAKPSILLLLTITVPSILSFLLPHNSNRYAILIPSSSFSSPLSLLRLSENTRASTTQVQQEQQRGSYAGRGGRGDGRGRGGEFLFFIYFSFRLCVVLYILPCIKRVL